MEKSIVVRTMDDVEKAASAMSKSGYFQDARDAAQSIVKILAGQEMGFGPFASMTGIYIIHGRPSIGANLMAAAVKASGRYNYRVAEMTDTVCEIVFFEQGQECGRSRFTVEDAKKAETKNLDKFPRNMLFARAMSNGCRWFTPDIFAGAPTYTPEELGANVNEAGEVIDIVASDYHQPESAQPSRQDEILQELGVPGAVIHETPQPQPQPASKPASTPAGWLIENHLADSDFSAKGIIKLWGKGFDTAELREGFKVWAKNYRAWRDAGADSKAASENAHAGAKVE